MAEGTLAQLEKAAVFVAADRERMILNTRDEYALELATIEHGKAPESERLAALLAQAREEGRREAKTTIDSLLDLASRQNKAIPVAEEKGARHALQRVADWLHSRGGTDWNTLEEAIREGVLPNPQLWTAETTTQEAP